MFWTSLGSGRNQSYLFANKYLRFCSSSSSHSVACSSVTFKYLTHRDEKKIEEELKGRKKANQEVGELTTRLKHIIQSVDGNYEKKTIREFIDNQLLARDSRALREHMKKIGPDVDMTFEYEDENGEMQRGVNVPLNITFLWPDAWI